MSRDRMSNIPFKRRIFLLSWDPAVGFMQCLDHFKFLEYLFGVEHVGEGMQMAEGQFLMSTKV